MGIPAWIFNQAKRVCHFDLKDYDDGRKPDGTVKKDNSDSQTSHSWSSLLAQNIISRADEWQINERIICYSDDDDLVVAIMRPVDSEIRSAIRVQLYRRTNSNGDTVYHANVNGINIDNADENDEICRALIYFNDRRVAKAEEQWRQQEDQAKSAMISDVTRALTSE